MEAHRVARWSERVGFFLAVAFLVAGGCGDSTVAPPDADRDGVSDAADNCPSVANPNQADADADGIGDVCETLQVEFRDESFHPTSWTVPAFETTGGATHSALQGSGELGHTGFYRRMVHQLPPGSSIRVLHLLLGAEYEPRVSGRVVRIDLEYDAALLAAMPAGPALEGEFVLLQNGIAYTAPLAAILEPQWTTFQWASVSAGDFRETFGAPPNWSRTANPISFGFQFRSANADTALVAIPHGLASLSIIVTSIP